MRKLFIHAGGGKTGSSALQNYFELNFDWLKTRGFSYENRIGILSKYQITSGNGLVLSQSILSNTTNLLPNLIESYFSGESKAICSSENFSNFSVNHWVKLKDVCSTLNIELHIVYYVRDPISYLLSGYDQAIKAHGEFRSFDEWSQKAEWLHAKALKAISNVFPIRSITVLNYNLHKFHLIESFFNSIGVDLIENMKSNFYTVNRSLTSDERNLLCMANKVLGSDYSNEIFNLFASYNSEAKTEFVLFSDEVFDFLVKKHSYDIKWINEKFFHEVDSLGIVLPERMQLITTNNKDSTKKEMPFFDTPGGILTLWALNKIKSIKMEADNNSILRIINLAQKSSSSAESNIPEDFDLVRYLILNPDVLAHTNDPIRHYIDYGKSEGRIYKIPGEKSSSSHQKTFTLFFRQAFKWLSRRN